MDNFSYAGRKLLQEKARSARATNVEYERVPTEAAANNNSDDAEDTVNPYHQRITLNRSQSISLINPFYNVEEYTNPDTTLNKNNNNNNNSKPCCSGSGNKTEAGKHGQQSNGGEANRNSIVNMLTRAVRKVFKAQQQNSDEATKTTPSSVDKRNLNGTFVIEDVRMSLDESNPERIQLSLLVPTRCLKKEDLEALGTTSRKGGQSRAMSADDCNSSEEGDDRAGLLGNARKSNLRKTRHKSSTRSGRRNHTLANELNECLARMDAVDSVTSTCRFETRDLSLNRDCRNSIGVGLVLFVVFSAFVNVLFGKHFFRIITNLFTQY
jgi:hypothetical protein